MHGIVRLSVYLKYPYFISRDKKLKMIQLKVQAIGLIEKFRYSKIPVSPFDLKPGPLILDINKFVKAQQHILEHVSPDKAVFKAALDRLYRFFKRLN